MLKTHCQAMVIKTDIQTNGIEGSDGKPALLWSVAIDKNTKTVRGKKKSVFNK